MGLWEKIKGEFIDIVEWIDDTQDTLVYRFQRYSNEIKYGARLVVRESQVGVFVNEGRVADIFKPGLYILETRNLPVLSTLQGWKHGFQSPFKAEVYFLSTRLFTDLKWGTRSPVLFKDPELGPVRLRAFGTYVIRVKDPVTFIRQIAGTDAQFTTDEITEQLRNFIVSRFADLLGESKIPVAELSAKYDELGSFVTDRLRGEFEAYGLELNKLLVENISLPPEVEEILDRRTGLGLAGNLQAYTQFQTANSIPEAARNPGGLAAGGIGLGMGMAMAGQVGGALAHGQAPPPLRTLYFVAMGGKQTGPFDSRGLEGEIQQGRLTRETLVWRHGMERWVPAVQVPDLLELFAQVPPPLPPMGTAP